MRTLDRYLIRTFLAPFFLCLVLMVGLFILLDFFENLDRFLGLGDFRDTVRVLAEYYSLRSISFLPQLFPFVTLMAGMLAVTLLEKHRELTAMRATGVSLQRIAAPLLLCGLSVSLIEFGIQEFVVPRLGGRLVKVEQKLEVLGGKKRGVYRDLFFMEDEGQRRRIGHVGELRYQAVPPVIYNATVFQAGVGSEP